MNQLCALVVGIPLVLFITPFFYILRSELVYWALLLISLLFPWIAFEIVRNDLWNYDVIWFVTSINSTTLLVLYKLFDRLILKLFDRPLFITWRGHYLPMNEGWLDLFFQLLLIALPAFWFGIGSWIF